MKLITKFVLIPKRKMVGPEQTVPLANLTRLLYYTDKELIEGLARWDEVRWDEFNWEKAL